MQGEISHFDYKKKIKSAVPGGCSPPRPPPPSLDPRLTVYGVFNVITAHEEFTFEYSY